MLILPTSGIFFWDRQQIAHFTVEHCVSAMFVFREWVDAGGLVSYCASLTGMFGRAAEYVDKLAKGAAPSDLPIEQPTRFELILNLKTAKEIGLTIPIPSRKLVCCTKEPHQSLFYVIPQWVLTQFLDDGRIELDTNAVERSAPRGRTSSTGPQCGAWRQRRRDHAFYPC
jgi:hypothetical protein